jgi:ubiquinone/menaquinone biosynthesis C-methylase UbiE
MGRYDRSQGPDGPDFRRIAERGLGDGYNSYAHSMAWFRDHLYVGTTRANLCMLKVNNPPPMRCWPTRCPRDLYDLDRRAQVWRYDPRRGEWERVFRSPMVVGLDGREVPRDVGYRGMAVVQGRGDPAPALYLATWSPSRTGRPSTLLRSGDGTDFATVPGAVDDPSLNTFRTLLAFDGRLFTTPTGKTLGWRASTHRGARENASGAAVVLESAAPRSGGWRAVSPRGFGDPDNLSIFEMAPFNGFLYAGTLNPTEGFQVWKARPDGRPPYRWTKVLGNGAGRGNLNECAVSLCPFGGALYVGTGIQGGGHDRASGIGPAAAEVLRIYPDDTWDLVVGTPRSTPQGPKYPLSGMGPGFDDYFNGYVWRMAVHDGWLYAGTFNWSVLIAYLTTDRWPAPARALVSGVGAATAARLLGGFDLWRTRDGIAWEPVTRDGFGNPYNYGARTLASTPHGLFVGTANPFGPDVAVDGPGGWSYRHNPRGGLEVWMGTRRPVDRTVGTASGRPRRGDSPSTDLINLNYDHLMYDPVVSEYYSQSGFHNFGYWREGITTQVRACLNLMEKLLGFIPDKRGTVLDVACGLGATTRFLMNYYDPSDVTGINISEKQLATCRINVPRCRFLRMDATRLEFLDGSFDAVLCVEAAFHFDTREDFLREAYRVLKPDGYLVLSDILFQSPEAEAARLTRTPRNFVGSIGAYRNLFERVGFEEVRTLEATRECHDEFRRHLKEFLRAQYPLGVYDRSRLARIYLGLTVLDSGVRHYLLVSARKPIVRLRRRPPVGARG